MLATNNCNRTQLIGFLANQLEIDEQLEFLNHVKNCTRCWEQIYSARKAEHPHFYKSTSRSLRLSDRELRRIDAVENVEEEAYEVA